MKKTAELVFIPSPGVGHLASALEMANLLIGRDQRLFITVIIMKVPFDTRTSIYTQSISQDANSRIRFIEIPHNESNSEVMSKSGVHYIATLIETNKTRVRDVAAGIQTNRLAGFVVDMFCSGMMDVADELGVPTYLYFTSSAGFLGLVFHLQSIQDDQNKDITQFKDSDTELSVPSFANSVPTKVLPSVVLDNQDECSMFLALAQRFRRTKGIMVNTFMELESYAVKSLSDGKTPPVYPVGPVLNLKSGEGDHQSDAIMSWLDDQPPLSVVFLCFGSMGSFSKEQVKEIADALERSSYRFLWSLRQPPPKGKVELPKEYENPEEVLPEGFLERTAGMGKVIGWAPQVAVLSHTAVGGFVSHCGWNSTLESVWCGVPMAAWPLYAEQQLNAFEMVKELGLAVAMKIDYRRDFRRDFNPVPLTAKEIESVIRKIMRDDGEIRKKVNEMKEKSKEAVMEGGSSCIYLGRLIEDVIKNMDFRSQKSIDHE